MTSIPVAIAFQRLFCFQGADENGESEPYLWVAMIKLDGSCITQNNNALAGSPATFFSTGSHGNIGSGILPGFALTIPQNVGTWRTTLQPILITDAASGETVEVPGVIFAVAILLEQNSTPDSAIEAGHDALNTYILSQVTSVVSTIDLTTVSNLVGQQVANGVDQTTATQNVIMSLLQPAIDNLKDMAKPKILAAIIKNLGLGGILDTIFSLGDGDAFQGVVTHMYSQTQLAQTASNGALYGNPPIAFNDTIAETDDNHRWQFDYTLGGFAWRTIEETITQIPEGVPAGRWQVTGVNKAHSATSGREYIIEIAGALADGSLWWVAQANAIALLQQGTNTFFVAASDGAQAEVLVGNALPVHRSYLTTKPDASKADNLANLPAFLPFIETERNDP